MANFLKPQKSKIFGSRKSERKEDFLGNKFAENKFSASFKIKNFKDDQKTKLINLSKNKKADERVLSIYLFIIYIIVSIGIVSGVLIFYGKQLDIRYAEAGMLNNKVIDCLVEQGKLNPEILKADFNIINFCNLNLKDNTQKSNGEEQYAIKISLFKFNSCSKNNTRFACSEKIKEISEGRKDFFEYCGLEGKKIPKCETRKIYVLNNKEEILIELTSAVGKVGQNA